MSLKKIYTAFLNIRQTDKSLVRRHVRKDGEKSGRTEAVYK